MELFKRADHKEVLVSKLAWQVLDPFSEKAFSNEQISQLIAEGQRHVFKYKNGADANIGVAPEHDLEAYKGQKIYSVAAKVATTKRFRQTTSLVLVQNTQASSDEQDPKVFVVGLVSGNIVMDECVILSQINSVHDQYVNMCENTGRIYFIHGDVELAHIKVDHPYSLHELIDDASGKKVTIEPLKNDKSLVYFIYGVIAVMALGAISRAWSWYQEDLQAEIRFREETRKSPAFLYQQSAQNLLQSDHLLMPQAADQVIQLVEKFPVRSGGWLLETLDCDIDKCHSEWRSTGGTYADFKQSARQEWGDLVLSNGAGNVLGDLKTIKFSFPVKFEKHKLPPPQQWPQANEYALKIGSSWQKIDDWKASLNNPELQGLPPGANEQAVRASPHAIHAMRWETHQQSWKTTKRMLPTFTDNVVLKSFKVQVDLAQKTITFSAIGLAYVKK